MKNFQIVFSLAQYALVKNIFQLESQNFKKKKWR